MDSKDHLTQTVLEINARLLGASAFGGFGLWLLFNASALWWQFYLIGGICLAGVAGLLIESLHLMFQRYLRDKALEKYLAQGNKPKSSSLVSDEELIKAGLIDE